MEGEISSRHKEEEDIFFKKGEDGKLANCERANEKFKWRSMEGCGRYYKITKRTVARSSYM